MLTFEAAPSRGWSDNYSCGGGATSLWREADGGTDETETRCWWCDILKVTCCRWSDRNILVIWGQNHKVLLNLTKQKPKVEGRGSCSADGLQVIQCFRCDDVDLSHQGRVMMSDCGFTCIEAYGRLIAWLSGLMIWGTRCLTSSLSLFSIISRRLQCSWNQSDIMARPSLVASWPAHSPDISASQHVGWTVVSDVPLPVDLQQLVIRSRLTDSQRAAAEHILTGSLVHISEAENLFPR